MNIRSRLLGSAIATLVLLLTPATYGETTYGWDANGNMTSSLDDVGNAASYTYDGKNQLKRVDRQLADGTNIIVHYEYDWQGNRTAKTVNGIRTNFVIDSNRPLPVVTMETNASGEVLARYTYEPNGYLPVSQTRNGQTYSYHYDGSDNVRVLTDADGEVVVEYGYDSQGNLLFAIGEAENNFLFSGQQFDTETQLYYHRARYRDSSTNRFTQMDQYPGRLQEPATLHKYSYAHNDPINQRDPSGHFSIGNLNTALNIQATLTTTASAALRPLVTKAVLGTLIATTGLYLASNQATKLMVRQCVENDRTNGDKCRPDISIFVVGDSHDQIRDHVADAQASGSPSVVTKRSVPHNRNWIQRLQRAGIVCQSPGQCDEYPMATHEEGGEHGITSLRSVSAPQNMSIGGMVGQFHGRCEVNIGEKYKFIAVSGVPLSGGICKK